MKQIEMRDFPFYPRLLMEVTEAGSLHLGARVRNVHNPDSITLCRRSFKMPSRKYSLEIDQVIEEIKSFKNDCLNIKEMSNHKLIKY